MNTYRTIAVLLVSLMLGIPAFGQAQSKEQLGKSDFQNSCSPAVQEGFQRAIAMLHSFRYTETEKVFREVLAQDPSCASATTSRRSPPTTKTGRTGPSARAVAQSRNAASGDCRSL